MLILTMILNCPLVQFENKTNKWTKKDKKVLEWAYKKCASRPQNPCLKYFIKTDESAYVVFCGLTKDK